MLAIYKREMRSYFTTPIGYIFLAIFFAVSGAVFAYSTLYSMTADTTVYFTFMMFVFVVLLPLLTMKLFSEEKKLRTDQLLLTASEGRITEIFFQNLELGIHRGPPFGDCG